MTIDLRKEHKVNSCGVLNNNSSWRGGERRELMTEADRLVRKCQIVWIQQNRIGVAFDKESNVREPS